jgi:hypothetical protein
MIARSAASTLKEIMKGYPVVAINGPRQSGKTTLAKAVFADKPYVSLEDPDERQFAEQDPRGFFNRYPDGAVLDEVQRCPELFSYLQGIVDNDGRMGLFVLTGSQQFGLLSKITQSLAGRVGFVQLMPFSLKELQSAHRAPKSLEEVLIKGMYPPLYSRDVAPRTWHGNYVLTYVERDLRQMLSVHDLAAFQRFLRMCAARTGQLLNLSSLANDCGITHNTAKSWLSVLEASYLIHLLRPHHRNFNKRLVKMPKLYFFDTGIVAYLLGISSSEQIAVHPMRGAIFETFVISELLKMRFNLGLQSNLYFWRNNTGDEIDVIVEDGDRLHPIEIKSGQTVVSDYFSGLIKWRKISGTTGSGEVLVYGGEKNQRRADVDVISWRHLPELERMATGQVA